MDFLRAIGFSNIDNEEKLENLFSEVIDNCDKHSVISLDENTGLVEYLKFFGEGIGITLKGTTTEEKELTIEDWCPYTTNANEFSIINTEAHKIDNFDIMVECEDSENGNELTFSLQNTNDFLIYENSEVFISNASLSAYSNSGKILLPIFKNDNDLIMEKQEEDSFKKLLDLSRAGDNNAIQTLELQKSQCHDSLLERLDNEDLFSIIDSCFIPVDTLHSEYNILGNILETKNIINTSTNEEVTCMNIETLGTILNLYINSKDLEGLPSRNMRFYGSCCLSGYVSFLNNK